jgi:uncharacterized membrane protein YfcA
MPHEQSVLFSGQNPMTETTLILPAMWKLAYASTAVLIAGFIRGYSGFGFSITTVVSLSMVFKPVEVVPVVLLLEIGASSMLLPQVWKKVDWRSLGWLCIGMAVGTPLGVAALVNVPAQPMRAAIAVIVIILVILLLSGFSLKKKPGTPATLATGLASGTLNGAATIGGPPVILFFFSSQAGVDISRASVIAYFFVTDILASAICLMRGLVLQQTLVLTGVLLIPLIIGIQAGNHSFFRTNPETFKKRVMMLLMMLSLVSLVRSFL